MTMIRLTVASTLRLQISCFNQHWCNFSKNTEESNPAIVSSNGRQKSKETISDNENNHSKGLTNSNGHPQLEKRSDALSKTNISDVINSQSGGSDVTKLQNRPDVAPGDVTLRNKIGDNTVHDVTVGEANPQSSCPFARFQSLMEQKPMQTEFEVAEDVPTKDERIPNKANQNGTSDVTKVSIIDEGTVNGNDVILVTGGNGFLGQHVVKELQERAQHVKEIRVLDLRPFTPKLDYKLTKPVTSHTGSVTDRDVLDGVMHDVSSVIHIAGVVSYGTFPDSKAMESVNVDGTLTVIRSCLKNNVRRLLYCSTVDVVVGFEPIRGGTESGTRVPNKFLFPSYPDTKLQGEKLVLAANGALCPDGDPLHTVSLRANVMYGELDPYYVTTALRQATSSPWPLRHTLVRVGHGQPMFQQCYVGNTAVAFVQADASLRKNPAAIGGHTFFVPDDTPIQNAFHFMQPYLNARGLSLSKCPLPYTLVYGFLYTLEMVLKALSPLVKINLSNASCSVKYINMDLYFKADKAKALIGFSPVYNPAEAQRRSLAYYKSLKLP